jgi:hypothetical protein
MTEDWEGKLWFMYRRRKGSRWKTLRVTDMAHRERLIAKFDGKVFSWWAPT